MSMDPQPRNPRTFRVQLVSRTDRPTPNVNRAAPVNRPRLDRSLRVRDRFTRACASRRVIDPGEWPETPGVTFPPRLASTFSRPEGGARKRRSAIGQHACPYLRDVLVLLRSVATHSDGPDACAPMGDRA